MRVCVREPCARLSLFANVCVRVCVSLASVKMKDNELVLRALLEVFGALRVESESKPGKPATHR